MTTPDHAPPRRLSSRRAVRAVLPDPHLAAVDLPMSALGWRVSVAGLHATFLAVIALAAGWIVAQGIDGPDVWALAALGVLAVAYVLIGARAIAVGGRGRSTGYLIVLLVAVGVVAATTPGALFVLFLVYVQVWFLVERTIEGVVWTGLIAVTSAVGLTISNTGGGVGVVRAQLPVQRADGDLGVPGAGPEPPAGRAHRATGGDPGRTGRGEPGAGSDGGAGATGPRGA